MFDGVTLEELKEILKKDQEARQVLVQVLKETQPGNPARIWLRLRSKKISNLLKTAGKVRLRIPLYLRN